MKTNCFTFLCALIALSAAHAQTNITTSGTSAFFVPAGATIIVTRPTNEPVNIDPARQPLPPQDVILPMSMQMRMAAQMARGKAAPWCQRFIVTKVEEFPVTIMEDDETGLPNGKAQFRTNFVVTISPTSLPGETNEPVAWGAVKSKTLRVMTTRPAKKGDEYDFYPVP